MRDLLRSRYLWFCVVVITAWLALWLSLFHNLYGWLVDDTETFYRVLAYERGGRHVFDIIWFHAYMWFLMFLPWTFHWTVPSHVAARSYALTGQFRALILYTIFLHAIILVMLAFFLKELCGRRSICAIALLLFVVSPTFTLYVPLLDSRYLGFLAAIPAMVLMLHLRVRLFSAPIWTVGGFFVFGFLLAVAEDIHYECLYFTVPFCVAYWILTLTNGWRSKWTWLGLLAFTFGLAAWIIPIQMISLRYHPFVDSFFGIMLRQHGEHLSPYSWLDDLSTWAQLFLSEMGLPMILAVIVGAVVLASDRLRPDYISRFAGGLMVGSAAILVVYIVFSRTFPFYRMTSGMQIFYLLMAVVAIERISYWTFRNSPALRYAFAGILLAAVAFVPSGLRTPEVLAAHQGYGEAVNLAYKVGGKGRVRFIDVFDNDLRSPAIFSRAQFDALRPTDYLVTYYPVAFHFKYPDIFALLYDTKPVASYPTLWCTKEMWAQVPTFFGKRRWADEPPNCEAQVFHVADIRREETGPALTITAVTADSSARPSLGPLRVFAYRTPDLDIHDHEVLWTPDYQDLWVSRSTGFVHWLELKFAKPAYIRRVTVVQPELRVPPDFLWRGRKRNANVRIYGAYGSSKSWKLLWEGAKLQDRIIFTAAFPVARVSRLRFVVAQNGPPANHAAGITYIRFPGYRQVLQLRSGNGTGP